MAHNFTVVHSFMGVIVPYIQMDGGRDNLAMILYFLMVSVTCYTPHS